MTLPVLTISDVAKARTELHRRGLCPLSDNAIPAKLIPVFTGPARYRGAWGGRGSGKTRAFAKMTAEWGRIAASEGREGIILCAREFMNSLDDSSLEEVKAAIRSDAILSGFYELGEKFIRSKCGKIRYAFAGLRHNLDSLKSKARIILAWVDEAESVSESAWRKLIPTIREEDSELWITWNPERHDSPTNQRFREPKDDDAKIVRLNYTDNPWFPAVLEAERMRDLRNRPMDYPHVWEGEYKTRDDARVFTNWRVEEFDSPSDVVFRFGADWGFAIDPSVLVRGFLKGRQLYVDYEAYKVGCEIDHLPALFDTVPRARDFRITADSARPETVSYMRRNGYPKIVPALKGAGSIEDGVAFLQSFEIIIHPRCVNVAREVASYAYKVDRLTEEVLPFLEDKDNHTIDALRYALEGLRRAGPFEPEQKIVHTDRPSDLLSRFRDADDDGGGFYG